MKITTLSFDAKSNYLQEKKESLLEWLHADSVIFSSIMEEKISRTFSLRILFIMLCFVALLLSPAFGTVMCLICFIIFALSLLETAKYYKQVHR